MHFVSKILAALLCILLAASPAGSGSMLLTGVGPPPVTGGGANNIALDGSAVSTGSGTTQTTTISTTLTNDLIIIETQYNSGGITGVSGGTLGAFTLLNHTNGNGGNVDFYYAFSAGILASEVITITWNSSSGFNSNVAFALHGTVSSSFFDANGALPGITTTTGVPLTLTTSNANDFLFAAYADNTGNVVADTGGGWTLIPGSGGNFNGVEYKLVTATQSALAANIGTNSHIKLGVGHAVKSN